MPQPVVELPPDPVRAVGHVRPGFFGDRLAPLGRVALTNLMDAAGAPRRQQEVFDDVPLLLPTRWTQPLGLPGEIRFGVPLDGVASPLGLGLLGVDLRALLALARI